jgi:hypothetical protein
MPAVLSHILFFLHQSHIPEKGGTHHDAIIIIPTSYLNLGADIEYPDLVFSVSVVNGGKVT